MGMLAGDTARAKVASPSLSTNQPQEPPPELPARSEALQVGNGVKRARRRSAESR